MRNLQYRGDTNTVRYSIGTSETVQYFNGTLLHYYLINFIENSHVNNLDEP